MWEEEEHKKGGKGLLTPAKMWKSFLVNAKKCSLPSWNALSGSKTYLIEPQGEKHSPLTLEISLIHVEQQQLVEATVPKRTEANLEEMTKWPWNVYPWKSQTGLETGHPGNHRSLGENAYPSERLATGYWLLHREPPCDCFGC